MDMDTWYSILHQYRSVLPAEFNAIDPISSSSAHVFCLQSESVQTKLFRIWWVAVQLAPCHRHRILSPHNELPLLARLSTIPIQETRMVPARSTINELVVSLVCVLPSAHSSRALLPLPSSSLLFILNI